MRRFLDARAERAAGHDRARASRRRWRDVLAKRTPPLRAARSGDAGGEAGLILGVRRGGACGARAGVSQRRRVGAIVR